MAWATKARKKMGLPQGAEWIIILVVVLLLFGIGRIGKLGEELGKGVRAFRQGVKDGTEESVPARPGAEESETPKE
jgi:sec-independent protein translocase protein TatA